MRSLSPLVDVSPLHSLVSLDSSIHCSFGPVRLYTEDISFKGVFRNFPGLAQHSNMPQRKHGMAVRGRCLAAFLAIFFEPGIWIVLAFSWIGGTKVEDQSTNMQCQGGLDDWKAKHVLAVMDCVSLS